MCFICICIYNTHYIGVVLAHSMKGLMLTLKKLQSSVVTALVYKL